MEPNFAPVLGRCRAIRQDFKMQLWWQTVLLAIPFCAEKETLNGAVACYSSKMFRYICDLANNQICIPLNPIKSH